MRRNRCRSQLLLDAKEEALQIKTDAEQEAAEHRKAHLQRDAKLDRREELLQQQEDSLRKQQRGLESSQLRLETQLKGVAEQRQKLQQTLKEQLRVLELASGMSKDEASQKLMSALEQDLEHERGSALIKHQKVVVRSRGKEKSRNVADGDSTFRVRSHSRLDHEHR